MARLAADAGTPFCSTCRIEVKIVSAKLALDDTPGEDGQMSCAARVRATAMVASAIVCWQVMAFEATGRRVQVVGSMRSCCQQRPCPAVMPTMILRAKRRTSLNTLAAATEGDAPTERPVSSSSSQETKRGTWMTRMEAKKVVPLAIVFFCVLFNYTILRDTKDVLVVTAPKSGAEIIPFLKTYVNLPGAISFTVLFAALSNRFSQPQLFRGIVTAFLSFFSLFATVLYPNRSVLHPNALCDVLAAALPAAFAAPIAIVRNWTFSIFYMLAELWGSVVASLLFWGLANSVMTVSEAKRYYPLFGLFANIALVFSGQYVKLASSLRDAAASAVVDPWAKSLELLIGGVVASGAILLAAHEFVQRKVVTDPNCVDATQLKKAKAKTTMTVAESVKTLAANPYMREMATLVVSYGFAINIVEVSWKAKLKQQFSNPSAYAAFMVRSLVCARMTYVSF